MSKLKRKGMLLVVLGLLLSLLMFSGTAVAGLAAPARDAERNTGMTLMANEKGDFDAYVGDVLIGEAIAYIGGIIPLSSTGFQERFDSLEAALRDFNVENDSEGPRVEYVQILTKYFDGVNAINSGALELAKAEIKLETVKLMFQEIIATTPDNVTGTFKTEFDKLNTLYINNTYGVNHLDTELKPLIIQYIGKADELIEKAADPDAVNKAELVDELDWILAILAVEGGSYLNTSSLNSFNYYRNAAENATIDGDVLANYFAALGVISTWLNGNYNSIEAKIYSILRTTYGVELNNDIKAENTRYGYRETVFGVYTVLNYLLGHSSLFSTGLIELVDNLYERAIHTFEIEIAVDTNKFDLEFVAGNVPIFFTVDPLNSNEVTYKEFYLANGVLEFRFVSEEGFDFESLDVSDWNGESYDIIPEHSVDFDGYQLNEGAFTLDFTNLILGAQDWADNKVITHPLEGLWSEETLYTENNTIYTNIFDFTFNKGMIDIEIGERIYYFNVTVVRDYETSALVTSGSGTYERYVGNEFPATYDGGKGGFFFDDSALQSLVGGLFASAGSKSAFDGYRLVNATGAEFIPGNNGKIFTEADTDNGRITIYARFVTVGNPEEVEYTNSNDNDENIKFAYDESTSAVQISYSDALDADFVAEFGEETAFVQMFIESPISNAVGYYLTTDSTDYGTSIYDRPTQDVSGTTVPVTVRDSASLKLVGGKLGATHNIMLDYYPSSNQYEVLVYWYGMGGEVVAVSGVSVTVVPYMTYTIEFTDTVRGLTGVEVEAFYFNRLVRQEIAAGVFTDGTAAFEGNDQLNIKVGDKKTIEGKEYIFGGWKMDVEVSGSNILPYHTPLMDIALAINSGLGHVLTDAIEVEAIWYEVKTLDVTDIAVLSNYDDHNIAYDKTTGENPIVKGAHVSLEGTYKREWLDVIGDGSNDVNESISLFLAVPEDAESYTINIRTLNGIFPMTGAIGATVSHTFEGGTAVDGIVIDLVTFVSGTFNGATYDWLFGSLFDDFSRDYTIVPRNGVDYWAIPMSIVFEGDGMTGEAYDFTLYYKVYNEYTVSYDVDGGSVVAEEIVAYGYSATAPASAPTKSGYVFDGWFVEAEGENDDYIAWNFANIIEDDITIVAKWTAWRYNVVYYSEYVGVGDTDNVVFNTVSLEAGDLIGKNIANINELKTGYAFAGWMFIDGVVPSLVEKPVDHGHTYSLTDDFGMTTTGASVALVAVWVELEDMTGLELEDAPYGMTGEEGDDVAFVIDFEDIVDWKNSGLTEIDNILYVTVSMTAPASVDSYYVVNTNSLDAIKEIDAGANPTVLMGKAEFQVPVAKKVGSEWVPFGTQNRNDAPSVSTYFEVYFYAAGKMVAAYNGNIMQANYQVLNVRFDFNYKTGDAVTKDVKILSGNTIEDTIALRTTIPSYGSTSALYIPTGDDVSLRTGYEFIYWELSTERPDTSKSPDTNLDTPITRSIVLVAVNDVTDVRISFYYYNYGPENTDPSNKLDWDYAVDALGEEILPLEMKHDDRLIVPMPVLEGYEFQYWTTKEAPVPGNIGSDFFQTRLSSVDGKYLVNCEDATTGELVLYAYFVAKLVDVEVSGDYKLDGGVWTETNNNKLFKLHYNTRLSDSATLGDGIEKRDSDFIRTVTTTEGSTVTTTSYIFNGFWHIDGAGNRIKEYNPDNDYFKQNAKIEAWWVEIESVTVIGGVPEGMTNDGLVFDYEELFIEGVSNQNKAHFVDNDKDAGTVFVKDGEIYILVDIRIDALATTVEVVGDAEIMPEVGGDNIRTANDGSRYVQIKIVIGKVESGKAIYGGKIVDASDVVIYDGINNGEMQLWVEGEDGELIAVYFEEIVVANYLEFLNDRAINDGINDYNGYMTNRVNRLWNWVKTSGRFEPHSFNTGGDVHTLYTTFGGKLATAKDAEDADTMIALYREFYLAVMMQSHGYEEYLKLVEDFNSLDERYYSPEMWERAEGHLVRGAAAILTAPDPASMYKTYRSRLLGLSNDAKENVIDLWAELVDAKMSAIEEITADKFAKTELKADEERWAEYTVFFVDVIDALRMPGGEIERTGGEIALPEGYSSFNKYYEYLEEQIEGLINAASWYSQIYQIALTEIDELNKAVDKLNQVVGGSFNKNHKYYAETVENIWFEFDVFTNLCDPANTKKPSEAAYMTQRPLIQNAGTRGRALIEDYTKYGWERFVATVDALYAKYDMDGTPKLAELTRADKDALIEADYEYTLFEPSIKNHEKVVPARIKLDKMMGENFVGKFEENVKTVVDMFKLKIAELAPNNEQNVIAKNAAKLAVWYATELFPAYADLTAGEKEDFNYQIAALGLREFDTKNYEVTATLQGFYFFLIGAFDAAEEYGYLTLKGFNDEFKVALDREFASIKDIRDFCFNGREPANAKPVAADGQMLLGEMGMQMFADSVIIPDIIIEIASYLESYNASPEDLGSFLRFDDRYNLEYYANFYFTTANPDYYMIGDFLEVDAESKILEMYEYSLGIFAITVIVDAYDEDTEIDLDGLLADLEGDEILVPVTTETEGNITTYEFEVWFASAKDNTVKLGDYTITVDGDGAERRLTEVSLNDTNLVTSNNMDSVDANGWILTADTAKDWKANVIVITADSIRYDITFVPNLPTRRPAGTDVTLAPIDRVPSGYTVGEWYEENNEGLDGFDAFLNTYALELDSHEFLGWFIDGDLSNEFFFKDGTGGVEATVITADITVVAMWKSHVYTITVEYNDGVASNYFSVEDIPWGYTVDEYVETLHAPGNHKFYLDTPERPNRWTFGGWYIVEGIVMDGEVEIVTFATEKFDFLNTIITHETVALETATAGEYEILIRAFWTETATPNIWLDDRTDAAADTELYTDASDKTGYKLADYAAEYTANDDRYNVNTDATGVLVHTDIIDWDSLGQDNNDGFILSNNYAFIKVIFKGYNGAKEYKVKSERGTQTVYLNTLTNEVLGANGYVNLALAYCDAEDDYKWSTLAGTQSFTVEAIDVNGKVIALYTFSIDVHEYVEHTVSFIYHGTDEDGLKNITEIKDRQKSVIKFIYGATPEFSHFDEAKKIAFADENAVNDAVWGYTFMYWYTAGASIESGVYVDLADVRLHGGTPYEHTYYAFWQAQTFTVRFLQADGTFIDEMEVGLNETFSFSELLIQHNPDDYVLGEGNIFVGWEARSLTSDDVIPFLNRSSFSGYNKITSDLVEDYIAQGEEYGILNLYLREVLPYQLTVEDFGFSGTGMEIIDYKGTVAMDYLGTMDWSKLVVHADEDCTDDECNNASHLAFNVQLTLNNEYLTELNAINVFDAGLVSWGLDLDAGIYNGSEQTNDLNKIAKMQFTVADSNGPRATGSRQQYLVGDGINGSKIMVYYFDEIGNIIGVGYALIGLRNYEEVIVHFNLNDAPADIGTEYEYGTVPGRALYGKGLDVLALYNGLVEAEDKVSDISEIFPKNSRTLIGFILTDSNGISLLAKTQLYVLDDEFIATAKEMYPTWDVLSYGSLTFTGTTYLKAIYDAEDVNVYFYDYENAEDILKGTAGYPENATESMLVGFSTLIEGDDIPELTEFDGYDLDASYWTADSTWSLRFDANGNIEETSKPTPFDFVNTYISGETKLYAFYMPHAYNISYIVGGAEVLNQNYYYGYVIEMPMVDVADIGNDSYALAYWADEDGNRFDFNPPIGMGNTAFWAENDDRALVLYAVVAKIVPLPEESIEGFDLFDNDNIDDYTEIRDGYFEFSFYVDGFFGTDKFDKDISYRYWDDNGIANYEFTIAAYVKGDDVAKTAVLQTKDENGIRNDALAIVDGFVTVSFSISQFADIERTFTFIWIDEQGGIIIAEYLVVKMNNYYDSVNLLMEDMMDTNFGSDEFKEKYDSTQEFFAEIIEEFAPIVADLEKNLDKETVRKFREWLKGSIDGILDDLLDEKFENIGDSPYLDETKQTIKNAVEIYKYRIQNAASFEEMFTAYEDAIGFINDDIMRTAKEIYIGMLEDYVEGIIEQYGLDEEADADLIEELWTVFDVASAKIMSRNNLIEMDATLDKAKTDIKEIALENLRTNDASKIVNEAIPAKYRTGDEYAGARKLFENARAEALAKAAKATTTAEIDAIYAELTEKFGEIEATLDANEQLKNAALTQSYLENLLKEVLKELIDNPSQNIGPVSALSTQEMNTIVGNLMTNVVGRADLSDDAETDIRAAIVKYIDTVNKIDIASDPRNEIAVAAAQLMADLGVILGQEDTRDRNAAAVVIEAIDALGKKAKKGDDKVIAARDKYDALTERQQNYVTNLYKLESIENPSNLKILVWITIILLILLIIIAIIILILVRRRNNDGDDTDGREEQPKVEAKKEEQKVAEPKPVTPARDTYIVEKTTIIERTTVDEKKNEDDEVELEEEELEDDEIEDEEIEDVEEIEEDEDDEVEPEDDDGTPAPTYNFNYNYTYATTTDNEEDDEEAKEKRKREPRKSFVERLVESHMTNKYYYSMLKNEILSYRTMRARMSKTIEKFNSGRIPVAKINLVGKTLRLYLALNPADYDDTLYHHKNVGDKRKYELTPLMVKVKSERSLNKALLLIAEAMSKVVTPNEKPVTKRRKFQEVDYVVQLRNNVATPIGARGMGHLIVDEITADGVDALPDYDATKCVEIREIPAIPNPVKESVSLETLEANFRSGEIIDLRALLKRKLVPAGTNFIKITAEGTLTKVFTVVANSYATVAVKMIALTGGIPVRLKGE